MERLLFFFMVCLAIDLTLARQDKGRLNFKQKNLADFDDELSWKHRRLSKFCSNNTVAQDYLTQILTVIDVLQANSSYESILKLQSNNFMTYLKDHSNQELLSNDCETFIKGLKKAKKADKAVEQAQKHLAATIRKQIKQVARDVTNGKGFAEFDN